MLNCDWECWVQNYFLKDGTSDWHILRLAWVGKGGQDYVLGVLKGVGLHGGNPPLF